MKARKMAASSRFGRFEGWRLSVRPGREVPTPAVAAGRIFVGGGFGSHEVYSFDLGTGELAWQIHTQDDGPTAVAVDGNFAAFNTESCTLEVVESGSGKTVWRRWLGDPLLAQPALGAGRVVMAYPLHASHVLAAFDIASGTRAWEARLEHDVITAPVIVGSEVYVATYDGAVSSFDLASGELKWRRPMQATSAPWIDGEDVYVARRGYRSDSGLQTPVSGAQDEADEWIRSVKKQGGHVYKDFASRPATYLKPSWGVRRKAVAHSLDAEVGFAHAPASAKLASVSALVGEDRVSRAWRYQGSRPVALDGVLFETIGDVLTARSVEDEKLRWEWKGAAGQEGERQITPPAVANGRVLVGTWDERLVSLDAANGAVRWEVGVGASIHWQPVMCNGWIVAGLANGELVAIRSGDAGDDGWPMWGGGAGHNGSPARQPARNDAGRRMAPMAEGS